MKGGGRPQGASPVTAHRFDRRVIVVGGVVFAVLMLLSGRYGFQRDELYFLDCARHLQAGYVDQPGLAPLLARVSLDLFGVSLPGLRLWPALAAWATVVIAGLSAREFGGRRRAQLLAAAGTATMPALLAADHIANTTSYSLLAWAALALLVVRIGRTGDCRWWPAAGVVLGIGWNDNYLIGSFAVALTIGTLLSGGRRWVWNGWFATGAALAALLAVPSLWWQAQHGWATITMTQALNHRNGGWGNALVWVLAQPLLAGLALVGVWLAGLRWMWRSGRPLWRGLVWGYALLYLAFAVTSGAQVYYLAGEYPCLIAAGAVALDGWLHARPRRIRGLALGMLATTAAVVPGVLPVLPPSHLPSTADVLAETVGWPELVHTVEAAWTALPPAQRADTVVYTADYSEAGAINELGRGTGLPTAVSGQNNEWWWGPGNPRANTVLVVTPGPDAAPDAAARLGQYFTSVRMVATLSNPYGVHNIESGGHVYLCTGPRLSWAQLWPRLRHYD